MSENKQHATPDVDQVVLDEHSETHVPVVNVAAPKVPEGLIVEDIMEVQPDENKKTYVEPAQKVTQDFSIHHDRKVKNTEHLEFPGASEQQIKSVLENIPNLNILGSKQAQLWYETLQAAQRFSTFMGAFVSSLQNEEADFRQYVQTPTGSKLASTYPRYPSSTEKIISGEKAMLRLESHLGTGDIHQVPLWHSGFWVTFKPPSEAEIVEINRLMLSEKYQFGRKSYGMVFSNTMGLRTESLVNLALSHVYQLSFKLPEDDDLRNYISIHDMYVFLWGFVCTMYPKGFQYSVACTADPEKCTHVMTETLNLTKLQWTNNKALNDWQKQHMSYRSSNNRKVEDLKRYKEELTNSSDKSFLLNKGEFDEIEITLTSPTVLEYIQACHRWIDTMIVGVEKTMEPTPKEVEEMQTYGTGAIESWRENRQQEKERALVVHANASAMRHYSHMVSRIKYGEDLVIEDRETIEDALARITSNESIKEQFYKQVSEYRDKACISLIGIPNFNCPNCGQPQKNVENYPVHSNIIPLEVASVFFLLVNRRLGRIKQR